MSSSGKQPTFCYVTTHFHIAVRRGGAVASAQLSCWSSLAAVFSFPLSGILLVP